MQQRSTETYNHILETAYRLFSDHGYDATGVAEICQAAGVSKGAFYYHFPSKQAVFLRLLDNWLEALESGLAVISHSEQDVPQILVQMARLLATVFQSADGRMPIFLEYWLQASRDETIWKATIAPYRHYLEFFTELVQRGIDEGSFRKVDARIAAQTLVSMAMGLLLQGLLNPRDTDWPQVMDQCLVLLLENLKNKNKGTEVL